MSVPMKQNRLTDTENCAYQWGEGGWRWRDRTEYGIMGYKPPHVK